MTTHPKNDKLLISAETALNEILEESINVDALKSAILRLDIVIHKLLDLNDKIEAELDTLPQTDVMGIIQRKGVLKGIRLAIGTVQEVARPMQDAIIDEIE